MSWPAVKFVDSPAVAAAVRLDMSTATVRVLAEGFTLGTPSFDGEPNQIGVDYGYRSLSFTVEVLGTKSAALATLQTLAREMVRRQNWLLFQLQSGSAPVWFKTYQGQPGDLSLEQVYDESTGGVLKDRWQIEVPLVAEGFAYGALETVVTNAVVSFDPAAGTNPTKYVVPVAIKGDTTAPAIASLAWDAGRSGFQHMLAVSRSTDYLWQVGGTDGWTVGADTGASTAGATFSGGTYRPVTFTGTPGMATRLSGAAPATVLSGQYRVFVRAARSAVTATFAMRFGQMVELAYAYGPTVNVAWNTSTGANHAAWIDVGVHNFPMGSPQAGEAITPNIALDAQRLTGSGELRLDAIKLIPVDGTMMYVDHPNVGPAGSYLVAEYHDAEAEMTYCRGVVSNTPRSSEQPALSGAWPTLVPGAANTNTVHLLSQTSLSRAKNVWQDCADVIADDAKLTLQYYPLYLNLRGD